MFGGNQPVYVPIAPKPPAMPTRCQLSTSSVTGTAWSMSAVNVPSSGNIISQTQSSSALVTQTQSTPSSHSSGNMVPHSQSAQSQASAETQTPLSPVIHSSDNVNFSDLASSLDEILSPLDCILNELQSNDDVMSLSHESLVTVNQPDLPDLNECINNFDITRLELHEDSIESSTRVQVWILVYKIKISFYFLCLEENYDPHGYCAIRP